MDWNDEEVEKKRGGTKYVFKRISQVKIMPILFMDYIKNVSNENLDFWKSQLVNLGVELYIKSYAEHWNS